MVLNHGVQEDLAAEVLDEINFGLIAKLNSLVYERISLQYNYAHDALLRAHPFSKFMYFFLVNPHVMFKSLLLGYK